MANEQNLRPGEYKLTQEEAKKGGRKSGESRRRKKSMREFAAIMAKAKVTDESARQALADAGIKDADMINDALIVYSVFRSALDGDMKAVEKWQALTGQLIEEERQPCAEINIILDAAAADLAE